MLTEDNVVQQLKLKNEESLSYILQTYGGLLNAIIRKYLQQNQQDIEECLADVLVSVWYHIDSFNPDKNEFKQWIAAIAKYRAIDYLRKTERKKRHISQFELNESIASQTVSDTFVLDTESLLDGLSDIEKSIFKNYYVDGQPLKEIASHFHVRESWVHNKLSRGRKKLKKLLLKNEG